MECTVFWVPEGPEAVDYPAHAEGGYCQCRTEDRLDYELSNESVAPFRWFSGLFHDYMDAEQKLARGLAAGERPGPEGNVADD